MENLANIIALSKSFLQNPYICTDLTAGLLSNNEVWFPPLSLKFLL
jgi:hypothetical protein